MLTRYMSQIYVFSDDAKQRIYSTGKFKLCNPTIWAETQAENLCRIPKTLRHFKNGMYLKYLDEIYKMPRDIDHYVRFAADNFDWLKV
jgi:hypothetical protein